MKRDKFLKWDYKNSKSLNYKAKNKKNIDFS